MAQVKALDAKLKKTHEGLKEHLALEKKVRARESARERAGGAA
jgi:hypothetical protein